MASKNLRKLKRLTISEMQAKMRFPINYLRLYKPEGWKEALNELRRSFNK